MCIVVLFFFFKQKTAYEMRISDWSSDVCSSDLNDISPVRLVSDRSKLEFNPEDVEALQKLPVGSWVEFVDGEGEAQPAKLSWISPISSRLLFVNRRGLRVCVASVEELAVRMREQRFSIRGANAAFERAMPRSEEHTYELQSLMRISYSVFCLK